MSYAAAKTDTRRDSWWNQTFDALGQCSFIESYCWVVYAAGFKNAVLEIHFEALSKAFQNFDLEAIVAMGQINVGELPIRNSVRAHAFVNGCRIIAGEGYENFKNRLSNQGMDMLEQLPGIGPITKHHLAKRIGLIDTAKPDVWLARCARACSATLDEFVDFLCAEFNLPMREVDYYLWKYCADHQKLPPV